MTASKKSRVFVAAAVALIAAGTGRAFAQDGTSPPPPPAASPPPVGGTVGYFGERGQIVVSTDLQLNFIYSSYSMSGPSGTDVSIRPAMDYFVSPNFSVGGELGFSSSSFSVMGFDAGSSTIVIGPRAGYNISLTNAVSVWLRAGIGYARTTDTQTGMPDASSYSVPIYLYAPFLWHPVSHFFIGFGPIIQTDLVNKVGDADGAKLTQIGLQSTLGGYFGGL